MPEKFEPSMLGPSPSTPPEPLEAHTGPSVSERSPEAGIDSEQTSEESHVDKDITSFEMRATAFRKVLDDIRWSGRGSEKRERLAAAFEEFFRPYQDSDGALSDILSDDKLAGDALQTLREAYLMYRDRVDGRSWQERGPAPEALPEFLSQEIVGSLDALDKLDWSLDSTSTGNQRELYNSFFLVSEALDTAVGENRKKLEVWLAKHAGDIGKLKFEFEYKEGSYDTSLYLALENILARVEDQNLAREILKRGAEKAVQDNQGTTVSEFFERVEEPLLKQVRPDDSSLVRRQEMTARVAAEMLGLDPDIVDKWREAKKKMKSEAGDEQYVPNYVGNLRSAIDLETERPGVAKTLNEKFGIANFARYDKQMLLRQAEKIDADVPYGIVVYPESDHNGAFYQDLTTLAEMALKLRMGGLETRVIEAGSQRELARQLVSLHKKYSPAGNKIAFAIVGGHGARSSVSLGSKGEYSSPPPLSEEEENYLAEVEKWKKRNLTKDRGRFTTGDIINGPGIRKAAEKFFDPDAPVVLVSCRTGEEGGIAETASGKLGFEMTAPDKPTSLKRIDVSFNESGKLKLDVEYDDEGSAKQYHRGKSKTDS